MSEASKRMHANKLQTILSDPQTALPYVSRLKEKLKMETAFKKSWYQKYLHANGTIRSLHVQIRQLKVEIKCLKSSLEAKEEQSDSLKKIIADMEAEIQDKSEQISEYLTRLTQTELRYESRIAEIKESCRQKLLEMQGLIQELRQKLDGKDQELEDLYNSNRRMLLLLNADSTNSGWTTATNDRNPKQKDTKKQDGRKNTVNRHNSRRKTARKPGGQPGHKGHGRKPHKPDAVINLPVPEEVQKHPEEYRLVGQKKRNVTDVQIRIQTTQMVSEVYENRKTGEKLYTHFPAGVNNEQNYGPQVRAMAFILTTVCNVSINKTVRFLSDITGGQIQLSAGMVSNLADSFSRLSVKERKLIYQNLISGHYMNHDLTLIKVNGKKKPVGVCVNKQAVQLDLLPTKSRENIKSGPIKDFYGVGIVDHDPSYQTLFRQRQECLVHIFRYLKEGEENEPERKWNQEMDDFLHELIEKHKTGMSEEEIEAAEAEYQKILEEGFKEYEKNPPEVWYPNGKNTLERMRKSPEDYLRFLRDLDIPWHNNDAEIVARQIKRKLKNAGTFRSEKGAQNYLNNLALLITAQKQGKDLFETALEILQREESKT